MSSIPQSEAAPSFAGGRWEAHPLRAAAGPRILLLAAPLRARPRVDAHGAPGARVVVAGPAACAAGRGHEERWWARVWRQPDGVAADGVARRSRARHERWRRSRSGARVAAPWCALGASRAAAVEARRRADGRRALRRAGASCYLYRCHVPYIFPAIPGPFPCTVRVFLVFFFCLYYLVAPRLVFDLYIIESLFSPNSRLCSVLSSISASTLLATTVPVIALGLSLRYLAVKLTVLPSRRACGW